MILTAIILVPLKHQDLYSHMNSDTKQLHCAWWH